MTSRPLHRVGTEEDDSFYTLFESLNQLLVFSHDVPQEDLLHSAITLAVRALPSCDCGSISIVDAGGSRNEAATDAAATELDNLQFEIGQGPCIDAADLADTTTIEDVHEENKWPRFCKAAAEHGIRSVLSIPLHVEGASLGAFNLYARRPRAFGETERRIAALFASRAAVGLANRRLYERVREMVEHLQTAMKTRDVIGEAIGILMEREGCSEEDARALLMKASQQSNIRAVDIARRLVTKEERKGPKGATAAGE